MSRTISRRSSLAFLLTLLAATPATALTIAPSAQADEPGRVCMFQAPTGAEIGGHYAGHVGWAYRWDNGSGRWDFGATENEREAWNLNGTWDEVRDTFRHRRNPNNAPGPYYTRYRCINTRGHDQHAAFVKRERLDHTKYVLQGAPWNDGTNNCLTRAVEIFKAYDNSGGLNHLNSGKNLIWPNKYFADALDGFERARFL
ncbi:hypothetical protein [Streptomyces sp. NPDC001678]|uniref:hypothetical protein n=1 Tax=Streptomyces sp. NPDC001678 TaxID=3364599 RepID=UPI0036742DB1